MTPDDTMREALERIARPVVAWDDTAAADRCTPPMRAYAEAGYLRSQLDGMQAIARQALESLDGDVDPSGPGAPPGPERVDPDEWLGRYAERADDMQSIARPAEARDNSRITARIAADNGEAALDRERSECSRWEQRRG